MYYYRPGKNTVGKKNLSPGTVGPLGSHGSDFRGMPLSGSEYHVKREKTKT